MVPTTIHILKHLAESFDYSFCESLEDRSHANQVIGMSVLVIYVISLYKYSLSLEDTRTGLILG